MAALPEIWALESFGLSDGTVGSVPSRAKPTSEACEAGIPEHDETLSMAANDVQLSVVLQVFCGLRISKIISAFFKDTNAQGYF